MKTSILKCIVLPVHMCNSKSPPLRNTDLDLYCTDLLQLNAHPLANLGSLASKCKFAHSHCSSRRRASVHARLFFTHARL